MPIVLKLIFIVLGLCLIFSLFAKIWFWYKSSITQSSLNSFYTQPTNLSKFSLGDIIRFEPLSINVPNGKGYRILYKSELSTGQLVATSGMIFISNTPSPKSGRSIVAWAHGTIGMGVNCAPSRTANPINVMTWLPEMMSRGWVVVATDYYGLGTPGVERYLIGEDESRDVLNSVRAARNFKLASASNKFVLWGHSQGGHAVLFSANESRTYAPELNLIAVAAAAPATELPELMDQQYNKAVAWAIGPEMVTSWPLVYPNLDLKNVISNSGLNNSNRLANDCIDQSALEGIIRNKLNGDYFKVIPTSNKSWKNVLEAQTAKPVLGVPVFIAQGLADNVVLPNTTALYNQISCKEGSNLTVAWMGNVDHIKAAITAGPFVASWLEQRLEGLPSQSTCGQSTPVTPF